MGAFFHRHRLTPAHGLVGGKPHLTLVAEVIAAFLANKRVFGVHRAALIADSIRLNGLAVFRLKRVLVHNAYPVVTQDFRTIGISLSSYFLWTAPAITKNTKPAAPDCKEITLD